MNSIVYKWCAVPLCKNTSLATPNKVFVCVPKKKRPRDKWLKLARRDPADVATNSVLYFCEDHFDLPNDMENYMRYHVMGSVSQVRMKPDCIPTKFAGQPDRKTRTSDTCIDRPYICKKRKMMVLEECEKLLEQSSMVTEHIDFEKIASENSVQQVTSEAKQTEEEEAQQVTSKMVDISLQVHMSKKLEARLTKRSQISQSDDITLEAFLALSTSPFKINRVNCNPSRRSASVFRKLYKKEEPSDSDTSYSPSATCSEPSPSKKSFQMESTSDCSELIEDDTKREDLRNLECTINKITKNPRSYIGIPISCYYLIDLIQKETNIPTNHILLCLKKIRLNYSFRELADDFAMHTTYASKIFFKNIPILANVIRPFIVKLDREMIFKKLPMAFRHKYNKVTCIIDCMEIEIQKPSKALKQALSWSDYKKANTIKYLVSSTPNGLVNYISPGYGGRITDTCLVESCDFIKCLQPGMCVMADRGFKHVEVYLRTMGVLLVRPPSVTSGSKLSKTEAKETKEIASLRIHIERVIRRLREFNMIKPHACLNLNLVKVLDDVITIACGLINLQDSLIK